MTKQSRHALSPASTPRRSEVTRYPSIWKAIWAGSAASAML